MILLPRFDAKSINFGLSLLLTVAFVGLLAYSYSRPVQNSLTWNCSLFQTQNKYYPRIRYAYQLWRIPISGLFHSSIPHLVLNLAGLQIYGYFIEWSIGKHKFAVLIGSSIILGHLLGCVILPTSVSTVSSSILYAVLTLKLLFFVRYHHYTPLHSRRPFLYGLAALISLMNLMPIFVSNNVDFTNPIAGVLCGCLMGWYLHFETKMRKQPYLGNKEAEGDKDNANMGKYVAGASIA